MQTEPTTFAESVIDLLSSEAKRRDVGHMGMDVVRNNFGWDVIARVLEQYFENIRR